MLRRMYWILLVCLVTCTAVQAQEDTLKTPIPDSILFNTSEEEIVMMLLQERTAYQSLMLQRQRQYTYGLSILSALLVGTIVLLVRNNRKRRRANDQLALRSLRSQMNPHFIFNSLNSVNSFISSHDTREANKYLTDFSRMMRMVLDNSAKDFVPLDEELSAMSLYLKLEHVRFQDRFNYQFNVADSITPHQHRIPPMLVQPYIENAIWHGLRYKESMGKLLVSFEQNETHLVLRITDDGIGRAQSQKLKTANQKQHNSMGMKNTEERITLLNRLYKQPITVHIADLTTGSHPGTEVVIKIPLALTEEMT